MQVRFGSVCSGIEAASVAWGPLGWSAVWLSEIDPFASALLSQRHPDADNLGDMRLLPAMILSRKIEAPGVLAGGTPCQAFSIAGKRGSLSDDRGNLSLIFCETADAIDAVRLERGEEPAIIVWENVPGVLSTEDNAFGCFLAGLAGDDQPIEPGPRPEPRRSSAHWRWEKKTGKHVPKWPKSGVVAGPSRVVSWRLLDAQYFGLAQRRERVFVVASARNGFDPGAVLLEFDGSRRDSPPSRKAPQDIAAGTLRSTDGGSCVDDAKAGHLIPVAYGQNRQSGPVDVSHAIRAKGGTGHGDFESETFIVCHGTQDPDVLDNLAHTLGRNSGQENAVSVPYVDVCQTLRAGGNKTGGDRPPGTDVDTADSLVSHGRRVRRLTPVECERLMGFEDGYTLVQYRGKPAKDGPRYKAIGNSWAVLCARWIGQRINQQLEKLENAVVPVDADHS